MSEWTPAQKLELESHMLVLEAEDELRSGCADERVYDLVLLVTGSEDRASEAHAKRALEAMKRSTARATDGG